MSVNVGIAGGRISYLGPDTFPSRTGEILQAKGKYLLPGFIDIHHHGVLGFDCSWGSYQRATDAFVHERAAFQQSLARALAHCLSRGITGLLLTTMAAPFEQLLLSLEWIREFRLQYPQWQHLLAGINLEGSFIRDPAYAGAQNPAWFYEPGMQRIQQLQHACGEVLKIVNLPPEHGRLAVELTHELSKQGIVVAAGHSGASYEQGMQAIEAGLKLGVHFLNGPSKSSTKPFGGGGLVEAMLQSDAVSLELIVDGWHIHPAYVRDVLARKGPAGAIAITDSMFAGGLQGLRSFSLGGLKGAVSPGGDYLQLAGTADTLFGSILSPDKGLQNLLNWLTQPMQGVWHRRHPALSLEEALIQASVMLSTNPARLLGWQHRGSLECGKMADLLLLDIGQGSAGYEVKLEAVILAGRQLV
ncbi:MAG: hypothetical protein D6730_15835 [Bacteroidetes bacterium]|nr:MAG: hypothetical protein D6730_15835 [Bacteroidota bacterium]